MIGRPVQTEPAGTELSHPPQRMLFRDLLLDVVQDVSREGILILDEHGRVAAFNRTFADLWCPASGEPAAYSYDQIIAVALECVADRESFVEGTTRLALRRHGTIRDEVPLTDGRIVQRESSPLFGVDGTYRGRIIVLRDVTAQRQTETALGELESRLQTVLAERTHLVEEMRQAQKMEALGRLAGGVAHDFNNLLTAILGYAELVMDQIGADSPLRADIEEIRHAGESAAVLTHRLLTFSRREAVKFQTVALNDVVTGIEKMLRRVIGEDIRLELHLGQGTGRVLVDPGQVEQVIMNLVVNARDAMPEGGELAISTFTVNIGRDGARREIPPGHYMVLAATDDGCGMSEEVQRRIFEPFFTTKVRGKGTGLGLSTIHGIVKQSGGHITVHSRPGRGTTFAVYLPAIDGADDEPQDPEVTPTLGGTETILVVEDDDILRGVAVRILRRLGYSVYEASHAEEALAVFSEHADQMDLLLTDVVMPGLDGGQLAQKLLAIRPGVRVLYTSGYVDDVLSQRGVTKPGRLFLPKPYIPDVLARTVREVLDTPCMPDE